MSLILSSVLENQGNFCYQDRMPFLKMSDAFREFYNRPWNTLFYRVPLVAASLKGMQWNSSTCWKLFLWHEVREIIFGNISVIMYKEHDFRKLSSVVYLLILFLFFDIYVNKLSIKKTRLENIRSGVLYFIKGRVKKYKFV